MPHFPKTPVAYPAPWATSAMVTVASGNGKGQIFVKGEVIKTVPESKIVETLIEEAMRIAASDMPDLVIAATHLPDRIDGVPDFELVWPSEGHGLRESQVVLDVMEVGDVEREKTEFLPALVEAVAAGDLSRATASVMSTAPIGTPPPSPLARVAMSASIP